MYFLIEDNELQENYTICDKVSVATEKGFESEPVYNKHYLKNKIKSHGEEVIHFYH